MRRSHSYHLLLGGIVVFAISLYGFWYISAGHFVFKPTSIEEKFNNLYVDLGEAFLHGQTSLLEQPSPALMALPDPYNWKQRSKVPFIWDASYFNGKYYLYWGAVPGLMYAAVEALIGTRPPREIVVLFDYIALTLIFFAILNRLRKRYYPTAPGFSIGLFLLATFLSVPTLYALGRPMIYETSILTGQLFLILGALAWLAYLTKPHWFWLILCGLSWGLAVNCRSNLILSIAVFSIFVLFHLWRTSINRLFLWKRLLLFSIPAAVCAMGLLGYNWVRFNNPFENGFSYQLSSKFPEHQISPHYFPATAYSYLFYPLQYDGNFPFLQIQKFDTNKMPAWLDFADKRIDIGLSGLFFVQPLLWLLIPIPLLVGFPTLKREGKKLQPKAAIR